MGQAGDPVREIGQPKTPCPEELVGSKADHVRAPLFRIQDPVGSMLDSVHVNNDIRIDLPGLPADLFRFVNAAGNVGGRHTGKKRCVFVHQVQDGISVHASGLLIDSCDPKFHPVLSAVVCGGVIDGGMLQQGGHHICSGSVLRDQADHLHGDLGGGIGGIDGPALCPEDDLFNVLPSFFLDLRKLQGQGVGMLRGVRHGIDPVEDLLCFFQAQGPSGVVKEKALSSIGVPVCVVKFRTDLFQLFSGKHPVSVSIHCHFLRCDISLHLGALTDPALLPASRAQRSRWPRLP